MRVGNYNIIGDAFALGEFVDWLPELVDNEAYILTLFARKKYGAKRDVMLKRTLATNKNKIASKIGAMEIRQGGYSYEGDGVEPINTHLSVYINPNPRCLHKASYNALVELSKKLRDGHTPNPSSLAMSEVQKAVGTKHFIHLDIDMVGDIADEKEFFLDGLDSIINKDAYTLIETQGGYHMLITADKVDPEFKRSFYQNLTSLDGVDVCGDQLMPVVGCLQTGDFTPCFADGK